LIGPKKAEVSVKLIKINNIKEEMNRVEELYLSAFPANERFPFRLLKKRALQGKADFLLFSTAIPLSLNTAEQGYSTSHLSSF
jgi:hypothetical protein